MGQLEKEYVKQTLDSKLILQNHIREVKKEEENASIVKVFTGILASIVGIIIGVTAIIALFGISPTLGCFGIAACCILPFFIASNIKENKKRERKEREERLQSENYKKPIQIDSPTSMKEINKEFRRQESEGSSNFIQF